MESPATAPWGFLSPWCKALQDKLSFGPLGCEESYIDTWTNYLQVTLPVSGADEHRFRKELLLVREGLALLAAVAHVDDEGWKHLLFECGVDLDGVGESSFERDVPAKFILFMELSERRQDLVFMCGVRQRELPSPEYLAALQRIAEKGGGDVLVPVRVYTRYCKDGYKVNQTNTALQLQREEKTVKQQWTELWQRQGEEKVAPGSMRCTLVLEPMIVDFLRCTMDSEMAQTMESLVRENVWASQVALKVMAASQGEENSSESQKVFRQLMTSLFDSTARSRALANGPCYYEPQPGKPARLQFDKVFISCGVHVNVVDIPALFSAIAVSKTTREFRLRFEQISFGGDAYTGLWKWIAYAFFSQRARTHCSVQSLILTQMGLPSIEDVAGFAAILKSSRPEEELFGSPHGRVEARDATLNAGAPIRSNIDRQGSPVSGSSPISFEYPIRSVRTFSDDGTSQWVNALIPGLGRCHVMRSDLVFEPVREVEPHSSDLTSFTIRFHGFFMFEEERLQLLLAKMPSLKFVKIVCPTDDLDVNSIVQSCPNLERMELWRGHVNTWYDFTKCRTIGEPPSALNVGGWEVESLAEDLSSTDTTRIKSVSRLLVRRLSRVEFGQVLFDSYLETELKAMLHMLQRNKYLERLDIHLSTPYHRYRDEFKAHHLEPINGTVPFPEESKTAFLSAVASKSASHEAGKKAKPIALHQLNQDIVSRIFSFASSPVLREVYVELIHDGHPEGMNDEDIMDGY